ncbi:MAG: hypothetical protein IH891_10735, partial [Planctomycetes bacterium]|nr:hypothetical protein [Planctomycetota bacterium]
MTRLKGLCRFTVTDPLQRVLAEIFLGGPCDDVHSYPLGVSALFSSTCISSGVPISLMNRSARSPISGWRASHSLQLDETIAIYVTMLLGNPHQMAMVNNRHPLVPLSSLRSGFRLMLHGLSS